MASLLSIEDIIETIVSCLAILDGPLSCAQCALVCRAWRAQAQRALFRDIHVEMVFRGHDSWKTRLASLLTVVESNDELASCIRLMRWTFSGSKLIFQNQFFQESIKRIGVLTKKHSISHHFYVSPHRLRTIKILAVVTQVPELCNSINHIHWAMTDWHKSHSEITQARFIHALSSLEHLEISNGNLGLSSPWLQATQSMNITSLVLRRLIH
jgi:hypothetical protein